MLLRIVLHYAQIEVMKSLPTDADEGFFLYDDTNSLVGRNKELPKGGRANFPKRKGSCGGKRFDDVNYNTRKGKRRAVSLCRASIWKAITKEHIEKEGVRPADMQKTLGVDLRSGTVKLGAKEKDMMKTCDVRVVIAKRNRVIESNWMNNGRKETAEDGLGPRESAVRTRARHTAHG